MTGSGTDSQAVMKVAAGEKISGLWATPQIPDVGIYKLAIKKRRDGKYEWVHFQHRPDGTGKVLLRGEIDSRDRVAAVLEVTNSTLSRVYGVIMRAADFETFTMAGRKDSGTVH